MIGRRKPEMWLAQTVYSTEEAPRAVRRMLVPKEHVVFATRKHVVPLIEPVGSTVLGLLFVIFASLNVPGGAFVNLLWLGWLALLIRALDRLWLWWDEWIVLTTGRMLMMYGTIDRKVTARPLAKVHEWSLTRPFWGQILGYGHLEMRAHDDVNMKVIRYVPRPTELYHLIDREALNRQAAGSGTHGQKPDPWVDAPTASERTWLTGRRRSTTEEIPLVRVRGSQRLRALPTRRRTLDDEDDIARDHRDYFAKDARYEDDDTLVEPLGVHGRSDENAGDPVDMWYSGRDDDTDVGMHGYDDDAGWVSVHGTHDDADQPLDVHGHDHDHLDDLDDVDDGSSTS